MKKILLTLLIFTCIVSNAQTIVKGDMNDDGVVDVSDVTLVVSTILGNMSIQYINANDLVDPCFVDNSAVVGTWWKTKYESVTFCEDGTTDMEGVDTYAYQPFLGRIVFYKEGFPVAIWNTVNVSEDVINVNVDGTTIVTYTKEESIIWTFNPEEGLITDPSQLYANSVESEQFNEERLIDESDDYTNIIFHSSWSNPLPSGVYNYLQVHLNEAREDFIFTMIGSNWVSTYDTPDQMEILVSNEPENDLSWVSVANLPDMIPEELHGQHPAFYTSPRIALGDKYTDVRFVVKTTVNNRSIPTRVGHDVRPW